MKKMMFAMFLLFAALLNVNAGNDRIITKDKLPAAAQAFINTHFPALKLSFAKEDRDFMERSYEVVFVDGSKLEFTGKGEWTEVDCRYSEVPAAIIPAAIMEYVLQNFPAERVIKIERETGNYEVQLSNRNEITFDKKLRIIDIDSH